MPGLKEPEEEVLSIVGRVDVPAVLIDAWGRFADPAILDQGD